MYNGDKKVLNGTYVSFIVFGEAHTPLCAFSCHFQMLKKSKPYLILKYLYVEIKE